MSSETATRPRKAGEPMAAAHYGRLMIALAILVALFLVIRSHMIPDTFGQDGHYRAAAVQEIIGQQTKFVGSFGCGECHAERAEAYASSAHKEVSCETCHGPALGHLTAIDKDRVALKVDRTKDLCLTCHESIAGRPDSQPQIDLAAHAEENEFDAASEGPCLDCHSVEE